MTHFNKKIYIVIPAYNPSEQMTDVIHELQESIDCSIVCVNDGSDPESDSIFKSASDLGAHVLKHDQNKGKGCALKTAFQYIQENSTEDSIIATVDADGQHDTESVIKCIDALGEADDTILLGARSFDDKKKIPLRSRFGNVVTRIVTRFLCGLKVSDTQTGLRCFSSQLLPFMLDVKGERYEYEMNMLLDSKEHKINLKEVSINTIYDNGNQSSHFRPIIDSVHIYSSILKYIAASLTCFVVEYLIFIILVKTTGRIFASTYIARLISSLLNFVLNKKVVFKSDKSVIICIVEYYILAFLSSTLSATMIKGLLFLTHGGVEWLKMVVDTLIFVLNYVIQSRLIFTHKKRIW